jgi:hypothetical protein
MSWEKSYNRECYTLVTKTLCRGLSIHRHMEYPADVWLLSAWEIGMEKIELKSKDIEAAQAEAEKIVRNRLRRILKELTP